MAWCWGDNKRKLNVERLLERAWYPLETAVESHIESIYIVLTSLGSEPADIGPTAIEDAIQNINDSIYAKLQSLGQTPVDKKINSLNAKIQALTEIQWQQALSIVQITYTESGESKSLPTRDVPFNCRDLVNIAIAFSYYSATPLHQQTVTMGMITWYNASGTQVGTNNFDVTVSLIVTSGNFSQTFTPPSGAVFAILQFRYNVLTPAVTNITNIPTATFKYQTKVLR